MKSDLTKDPAAILPCLFIQVTMGVGRGITPKHVVLQMLTLHLLEEVARLPDSRRHTVPLDIINNR
jgi:hypothetical protein